MHKAKTILRLLFKIIGDYASLLRIPLLLSTIGVIAAGCTLGTLIYGPVTLPEISPLDSFIIADPYATSGDWYKAQLHVHSAGSIDSQWPVSSVLKEYDEKGYDFVAIADHDVITKPNTIPKNLIFIPAQESTIPNPFYPIGPHAVFLFVNEHFDTPNIDQRFTAVASQGGLISLAHPTWNGNLGHGSWDLPNVLAIPHFTLMEIFNPHSNTQQNEALWHEILVHKGYDRPVWAVATDDAHDPSGVDRGWTMVKADTKTIEGLHDALQRGSHFPTTGLFPDFWVEDNTIYVAIERPVQIEFIDGHNRVIKRVDSARGSYSPHGSEGFVRIALYDQVTQKRAWSQPFWLLAN